jgi:probable rRNA maturation factor
LGFPDGELSILLVDDDQIAQLNREYLRREGPTNVIAFPMHEGEFSQVNPQLLGDVVISVETAQREGVLLGITPERRISELLIHGVLHLFGYDHEKTPREARRMDAKTRELLQLVESEQR